MNNGGYLPLIFIGAANASPNQRSRGHDLAPLPIAGQEVKSEMPETGHGETLVLIPQAFSGCVTPTFYCDFIESTHNAV